MKPISNFLDYYDHWFDGTGENFVRLGTQGFSKPAQFNILENMGYVTPPHGPVGELLDMFYPEFLVVYEDIWAHTGDGKRICSRGQFRWDGCLSRLDKHRNDLKKFASVWMGTSLSSAVSWRYLQVGRRRFWVEYTSTNDWRSNCGDGDCQVIGEEQPGYHPLLHWPLFAIDFVIDEELVAIDLNNAPGIRGSGVEKYLSAREAHDEICEAYRNGRRMPTDFR